MASGKNKQSDTFDLGEIREATLLTRYERLAA